MARRFKLRTFYRGLIALPPNKWKSFRLAVIVNFTVDLQPRLLLIGREVFQNLHQITNHLFPNPPDQSRTFRRNADHHFASILPHARPHDVIEIFEPCDQPARRRRGMPHFLGNRGHGKDFLVVEESEQEKLRKGDVAWCKLFAEMQHEAALHFENNMRKPFRIGTNLIGWIPYKCVGRSCIQRA